MEEDVSTIESYDNYQLYIIVQAVQIVKIGNLNVVQLTVALSAPKKNIQLH